MSRASLLGDPVAVIKRTRFGYAIQIRRGPMVCGPDHGGGPGWWFRFTQQGAERKARREIVAYILSDTKDTIVQQITYDQATDELADRYPHRHRWG